MSGIHLILMSRVTACRWVHRFVLAWPGWMDFPAQKPMPTLYASEGQRKPKLSIIELVLYNIASMLAGVASGYDVRDSNVTPLHPRLHPSSVLNEVYQPQPSPYHNLRQLQQPQLPMPPNVDSNIDQ